MPEKKYAVITGGSKGLGFAFAKHLAVKEGYEVILIARSGVDLDSAVTEIEQAGGKAFSFFGDIADISVMQRISQRIEEKFKKIDFLINNACPVHVEELKNIPFDDIVNDVNSGLLGTVICTKLFIPIIKDGGKILFVSSGFGLMGPAGYSVYSAIKAGVINFAEAIKRELYKRKMKIYVAVPSDINTPGHIEEKNNMPVWMKVSYARGEAMDADIAAQKILKKCKGARFLIFTDCMVYMLYIVNKILPRYLCDKIIDNIFPRP